MSETASNSETTALQALGLLVTHLVAESCAATACPAEKLRHWKAWLQEQGDIAVRAAIEDRTIGDAFKLNAISLASEMQRLSQQINDQLNAILADRAQLQSGSIHP